MAAPPAEAPPKAGAAPKAGAEARPRAKSRPKAKSRPEGKSQPKAKTRETAKTQAAPLETPDGRYLVVRGRLWRRTRPDLDPAAREALVADLMAARRAVKDGKAAGDPEAVARARRAVDAAKHGLGERGPVWWDDGAPDLNRHMARTTPYAAWFATEAEGRTGAAG